jgi:glycyl-tRNA synthetase beta chain
MTEVCEFLFEVGTEELPPKALRSLQDAFRSGIQSGLTDNQLAFEKVVAFSTPRRLAVRVHSLARTQPSQEVERRGPPVSIAIGEDGQPTTAGVKFAERCGAAFQDLDRLETAKGDYLVYKGIEEGRSTIEILPEVVRASLAALPVPRRMRWASNDFEFVRPVHWIVAMIDAETMPMALFGIESGRVTRGHRFHCPAPLSIPDVEAYPGLLLEAGRVIASFDDRRSTIREQVHVLAGQIGGRPVYGDDLLDEVTALVEWPVPIAGRFEGRYLELPREVLISTLQAHQRYFPIEDEAGRLLPSFIAVTNLESAEPEQVREGNERVVRPRLSDAAFFWDTDRRQPLAARVPHLDDVVFQRKLGSLGDKTRRVAELAAHIAGGLGWDADLARHAATLARCDLLTDMVGEFPDLQGIMGRYYAAHDGEADEVCAAIEEQYLPRHAGDRLPATDIGRALSIAEKLDTLAGIFAIGQKPTGTRDPFGLRRAALGILRIMLEADLEIDLPALVARATEGQPVECDRAAVAAEVLEYLMDRLRAFYTDGAGEVTAPVEVFEAVLDRRPVSIPDFHRRIKAVLDFVQLPAASSLASANKRVANILRQAGVDEAQDADPAALHEPEEKSLYQELERLRHEVEPLLREQNYRQALERLAVLREPVDSFFDSVMVMDEDPVLRKNRLALLSRMRQLFLQTADLSRLGG